MMDSFVFDAARYSRDVFGGATVEVEACDERMNALRAVPPRADLRYGVVEDKVEVFYPAAGDKADAERLVKFLQPMAAFSPAPVLTFKLARRGDVVEVHMTVDAARIDNPDVVPSLDGMRKEIGKQVFGGAATELHLCNDRLEVQRVLN